MDSVKEIIGKAQPHKMISLSISDDDIERKPCEHGTMCMVNEDGSLCLWECSKCEEYSQEQERKAMEPALKRRNFNKAMIAPWRDFRRVPKRFEGKTINGYEAKGRDQAAIKKLCINYVRNFQKIQQEGSSMVFCGRPGTGKTHLCYAIVSALQKQMITAALITAADMTAMVKATFASDVNASDVVDSLAKLELLVIDEVGVQVSSEAEKRIFFDVMNKRYEAMNPTILISNLAIDELTAFIGERVIDRMNENCGIIFAFDWESYRK